MGGGGAQRSHAAFLLVNLPPAINDAGILAGAVAADLADKTGANEVERIRGANADDARNRAGAEAGNGMDGNVAAFVACGIHQLLCVLVHHVLNSGISAQDVTKTQ